jgi:hypothetical protein
MLCAVAAIAGAGPAGSKSVATPEPPRVRVETEPITAPGRTIQVSAGGSLQAALDEARPGDVVRLQAGSVFLGPFRLRRKTGEGWILVRSSASDQDLPSYGQRSGPRWSGQMPRLQSTAEAVLVAEPGAHHYRFFGIEMSPSPDTFLHNVVLLGSTEDSAALVPHHIIFDRCYIHGDPKKGSRRGIALNSAHTAVIDSWLSDFKEEGGDSQAIAGWNGPGPFRIEGNHLEAAGENILFGGAVPAIADLVPADVEIRRNHLFKPLAWRQGDPDYAGTAWTIKNLFELKNAKRVLVEDNLLENNWVQAQGGFAILLTVRTEVDAARWAVVEDVTFRNNVVRRVAAGLNILGIDDTSPGGNGRTRNVLIAGNLFEEIGPRGWDASGILFQILNGAAGITIEHNTAFQQGSILVADMAPSRGLVFRNNIAKHNEYGVFGGGMGSGLAAIAHYFPDAVFAGNIIAGTPAGVRYPPGNRHPASLADVGFVDLAALKLRLATSSKYKRAGTDDRDPGADIDALTTALRCAGTEPDADHSSRAGGPPVTPTDAHRRDLP